MSEENQTFELQFEKKLKTKAVAFRLSPKLHKEIIRQAKRFNTTQSDFIRACVDLWLKNQK